jgi:hypothetical protein
MLLSVFIVECSRLIVIPYKLRGDGKKKASKKFMLKKGCKRSWG